MNQRLDRIRILRALARPLVTVQSSCFDLILNGLIAQDFYRDPCWTWQRDARLSGFLFTPGPRRRWRCIRAKSGQASGNAGRPRRAPLTWRLP
jgi:hypothetical protein